MQQIQEVTGTEKMQPLKLLAEPFRKVLLILLAGRWRIRFSGVQKILSSTIWSWRFSMRMVPFKK